MNLDWNVHQFQFIPVQLQFDDGQFADVFAEKNNKTLRRTILHKRYSFLAEETRRRYPRQLDTPLCEFLVALKEKEINFSYVFKQIRWFDLL